MNAVSPISERAPAASRPQSGVVQSSLEIGAFPPKQRSVRGPLLSGTAAIALGLGGFTAFAATAPVATAVVAPGIVAVESDRQKLQHLEGGIIRTIAVREGEVVQQGATLFQMEPLQAQISSGILDNQIMAAEALVLRLQSERDDAPALIFPPAFDRDEFSRRARVDQERQFTERRASLLGQIGILEARIRQSEDQIGGFQRERQANESQLRLIESELGDARKLYDLRLITRPRLLALEREQARLSGAVGQVDANIARVRNVIEESRREIAQVRQGFSEKVAEELRQTRERLADLSEKSRGARDVLARMDVRAPRTGVVQALKVSTIGEVVQPGAVLLEIAPLDEGLIVSARVRPQDIDGLSTGMEASLRLSALPGRTTPVARARVISVSRDRLIDPATNEPYFLLRARITEGGLPDTLVARLSAGMPAEVIVTTEERTLLSYLVRPLTDALARGFRER